jgi:catechol 2,3-dioxygenase-like lactoylglutathione lyase family enzyme
MLSHISLGVGDLAEAGNFYDPVMAALGLVRVWSHESGIGYGPAGGQDGLALFPVADPHPPGPGFHLAFAAPDRASVDAFHAAALAGGGRDQGAPGLRPHYGADYYAAFVLDPEGHRLEAVCQGPVSSA